VENSFRKMGAGRGCGTVDSDQKADSYIGQTLSNVECSQCDGKKFRTARTKQVSFHYWFCELNRPLQMSRKQVTILPVYNSVPSSITVKRLIGVLT
jgi:hypothetical protein